MKSLFSRHILNYSTKLAGIYLAIEFVDELVDSLRGMSLPSIRSDLALSYFEVGVLISVPHIFGCVLEIFLGVLADRGHRARMMIIGGAFFAGSLIGMAASPSFSPLLVAMMACNPASGAFVSLAQASLMDLYPTRREQMMARWTVAGTLAHLLGPVIFIALVATPIGWRGSFITAALVALCCLVMLIRCGGVQESDSSAAVPKVRLTKVSLTKVSLTKVSLRIAISGLAKEFSRLAVLKWLISLELADLMLDVFTGFLALYLVDVLRLSVEQAASVIFLRAAAAVAGEVFVVFLLERIRGVEYLILSSLLAIGFYSLFLTSTTPWGAGFAVAVVTFLTSGWYSVLKAGLYSAVPNRSGAVMALNAVTGLFSGLIPLALSAVAEWRGLAMTMGLLITGAVAVLITALAERNRPQRPIDRQA